MRQSQAGASRHPLSIANMGFSILTSATETARHVPTPLGFGCPVRRDEGRTWYIEACRQHAPKVTSGAADASNAPAPYQFGGTLPNHRIPIGIRQHRAVGLSPPELSPGVPGALVEDRQDCSR